MVKFGRHLEAAVQHQQTIGSVGSDDDAAHFENYIVPYNEMKSKCIPPYSKAFGGEEKKEDEAAAGPQQSTREKLTHSEKKKLPLPVLNSDDVYFCCQIFKTEWRQCLASASRSFDTWTRLFWNQVFDGLEAMAMDNTQNSIANANSPELSYAAGFGGIGPEKTEKVIDPDDLRGALPDTALRLYLTHISSGQALADGSGHAAIQSLYSQLKNIHSTALINSEALRKLVKKFDKELSKLGIATIPGGLDGNGRTRLSPKLLPELYSAQFNVGLPTVEAGLSLIRYHIGLVDEEDDEEDEEENLIEVQTRLQFMTNPNLAGLVPADESAAAVEMADLGGKIEDVAGFFGLSGMISKRRVQDSDAILVEKRKSELRWLKKMVESLKEADERERDRAAGKYQGGIDLISALVGHRGYHSPSDKSDKRPIENSLMAYEAAWTNGIHSCECDVALTADDKLILCHDENFVRLALDKDDPLVHKNVRELTYREIMSLPLKSGNRPVLLFDVLRSAHVIGGKAKMIVEIKPGNVEAGTALAKLFARHPHLMERVSVVMSFDAYAMQNLKRELEVVFPSLNTDDPSPTKLPSPLSSARVGSPEAHELAAAGLAVPDRPHTAGAGVRPVHGHRRGVSMGGAGAGMVVPAIPSQMSIGDIAKLIPPLPPPGADQTRTASGGDISVSRSRSKSIDQLGFAVEGLDIDGDGGFTSSQRKDSFNFSPFKQISRVPSILPSMPRQKSTRLEPIPGGVRVENASPHPTGAAALDVLSMTPPKPVPILVPLKPPAAWAPTPAPVAPVATTTVVVIPQLLLITRCGAATNKEQEGALEVDISKPSDLKRARAWLHGTSPMDRLDGLYMQYQPIMREPEGITAMRSLSDHYVIGLWGANVSIECQGRAMFAGRYFPFFFFEPKNSLLFFLHLHSIHLYLTVIPTAQARRLQNIQQARSRVRCCVLQ
mmetsp:Transcript_26867/g.77464  ORF Transcript_26867/g.77464 Transcript_26867/m.77464 type:complete len:948 (+) Transcript_26867:221-3064(+)